ncbi:MAG: alpha/beta fold hydrolase [Gemmatimonadota bacterium]|nr:alpha/beta fold hydrolase [Gemmatimonadota bacterium]
MTTRATPTGVAHPVIRVREGLVSLSELELEHGGRVRDGKIAYRMVGEPGAPVIAVLGGISADRVVAAAQDGDIHRGWWEWIVGPGRPLDLREHQVLTIDYLFGRGDSSGEAVGATLARDGPVSVPLVTPTDQAHTLAAVTTAVGARPLCGLIGASYGGAVALSFAAAYPERVQNTLVIGAADRSHPMATAVRVVQRRIVQRAAAAGDAAAGVALARALAMTTYRSDREFAQRFQRPPTVGPAGLSFPVEFYIDHHGQTFARRFTPAQFLCLSQSSDLHSIDAEHVRTPVTLVSTDPDFLAPRWQLADLARRMGAGHRFVEVKSLHGHDAFLTDEEVFSRIVLDFVGDCGTAGVRTS